MRSSGQLPLSSGSSRSTSGFFGHSTSLGRRRKWPRVLLLLFFGACVFLILTPASLRLFGPPPGLGHLQNMLGFANGTALNAVAKGQDLLKDSSTVLDFAPFKPHKAAVNNNVNAGDTAHSRLSASSSSSCPHPFRSPPLPPMSLHHATDLAMDRCRPLDTVTGDFTISICPALPAYSCNSFFVVVQRTDSQICSTDYAEAPLSAYKQDADDIRQSTGPDTFQVMVTGSERYATSRHTAYDKYLAPCRYVYPVTLSNAGSFYLQVHQIWDEWHGDADKMARTRGSQEFFGAKDTVNDDGHHVPPLPRLIQRELLTGGIDGVSSTFLPTEMQCPASCQRHAFTANTGSSSSPTGSLRILDDNASLYQALPLCSMTDPIKGAYFPDATPVQNASLPIVPYRWHPLGCRLSQPNVELLNGKLGKDRREQCLTPPRRIVFDGDSHTRMSYDALMPRLKDDGDALPIFGKAKMKEDSSYMTTFGFIWDSHLNRLMGAPGPPTEADVVVLSVGSHQARNRYVTRIFKKFITGIMSYLTRWSTATRVLFITPPAKQPYNGDWRTHPRIDQWSQITRNTAYEAGLQHIGFVDGYNSTLPFTPDSPDGIHFRDLPAQEAWLLELMHKMNLCDDPELR